MKFMMVLGLLFVAVAMFKFFQSLWGGSIPDRSEAAPPDPSLGGDGGVHS